MRFAAGIDLVGRPLRVELEDLPLLSTPCILHFDMNHFVVLKKATSRKATVYDPALGRQRLTTSILSRRFTGVVLELTPASGFMRKDERQPLRLRDFFGQISGMKTALAQVFLLAIVLEIFSLLSPLFLQLSIDRVIARHNSSLLLTLGIGFSALVVLLSLFGALRSWTTLYLGTQLRLQSYGRLFSHLLRLPVSWFEKRYYGDIISKFDGVEAVHRTLSNHFVEACLDGLVSLLALGVMFCYSRRLTAVVAVCVLIYIVVRHLAFGLLRTATEKHILGLARQQDHFIETLRGIRTIKVFGREEARNAHWLNLFVDATNAQVAAEKLNIFFKGASTLIFGLQSTLVVWLSVDRVLHGALSVGEVFAFVMYQEQFKARITLGIGGQCRFFQHLLRHNPRLAEDVGGPHHRILHIWPSLAFERQRLAEIKGDHRLFGKFQHEVAQRSNGDLRGNFAAAPPRSVPCGARPLRFWPPQSVYPAGRRPSLQNLCVRRPRCSYAADPLRKPCIPAPSRSAASAQPSHS